MIVKPGTRVKLKYLLKLGGKLLPKGFAEIVTTKDEFNEIHKMNVISNAESNWLVIEFEGMKPCIVEEKQLIFI